MMDRNDRNSMHPVAAILVGLLAALYGAFAGSVLLSVAFLALHTAYVACFDPHATRDGQYEFFTLMGTISYGFLLGAVTAPVLIARHYRKCHSDARTASLVCIAGGLVPLAGFAALVLAIGGIHDFLEFALYLMPTFWVPLLSAVCVILWGITLVVKQRAVD